MSRKVMNAIVRHSLWLSLCLHLLLLLGFIIVIQLKPDIDEQTPELIQSYLYQEQPQAIQQVLSDKKISESAKDGIEKPNQTAASSHAAEEQVLQSKPSASQQKEIKASKVDETVHLIGDKDGVVKPLVKLMGTAFYAKLIYPRIASEFNIIGTVYVGFTLYPDGRVTDVQIMQSSSADVLDQAAMNAVKAASPLKGVDQYLPAPKFLVVAFMFK